MTPQQARIIGDYLIADLEHEIPTTVRVIEAVPGDRHDYQPDPKSFTGLGLVRHLVGVDAWFLNSIADGAFGTEPGGGEIATPAEGAATYTKTVNAALGRVKAMSDDQLAADVDFFGRMMVPAAQLIGIMTKHSIHHRGQLSAYLRSMGGKVPGIYGPSGDSEG